MSVKSLKDRKLIAKSRNAKDEVASICIDLAKYYEKKGEYQHAINEYLECADIYKRQKKKLEYGTVNRSIGEAYLKLNNFEKALHYGNKYLTIVSELGNKLEEQRALATIGHIYLSTINNEDKEKLKQARKYFNKSKEVAMSLKNINETDRADIIARLYLNLGLVEELLGNDNEAIRLMNESIKICEDYNIYEQLVRGYMNLAVVYEKMSDINFALQYHTKAVQTAKISGSLLSSALLSQSEVFVRLSNLKAAKLALYKAYKIDKYKDIEERERIVKNLKVIVKMCELESKLKNINEITTSDDNDDDHDKNKDLKIIYEQLGDGCCELQCYQKAVDYYKKMLELTELMKCSKAEFANCYYSIAESYKDSGLYTEALHYYEMELNIHKYDALKESVDTLCKIIETKQLKGERIEDILKAYERIFDLCKEKNNKYQERRMIRRCIFYLKSIKDGKYLKDYENKLLQLNQEEEESSSSSSESEESEQTEITNNNIWNDVDLDNLDLSNSDLDQDNDDDNRLLSKSSRSSRSRTKNKTFKKNEKGETGLHVASKKGELNVVRHFIEIGCPVNVRDFAGWLPIHEACNWGHFDIVKYLTEKGANINDNAGEQNSVTPLIDAATNGYLDIVNYLLDKGASPLYKTRQGQNVLMILSNKLKTIDSNDKRLLLSYQQTINRIKTMLTAVGENPSAFLLEGSEISSSSTSSAAAPLIPDDDDDTLTLTPTTSLRIKRTPKKIIPTSSSSGSSDEGENVNVYKDAIEIVKSKASKALNFNNNNNKEKNITSSKSLASPSASALIASDVYYVDDWMEDDVGKVTKKRKTPTTTLSLPRKKQQKQQKQKRKSPSSSFNNQEEELIALEDIGSEYETTSSSSSSNNKIETKRKRQINKLDKKTPTKRHRRSCSSSDSTIVENNENDNENYSIDVRINEKLLRIPIKLSEMKTKTIKWLSEEAALRYAKFKREYIEPVLELQTKDGALLYEDDLILTLFNRNKKAEEIHGLITSVNLPPILDRYKKACLDFRTKNDQIIIKKLQQLNIDLNMENMGILNLNPLCKALFRENHLKSINFSGNYFTTDSFQLLANALETIDSLTSLNLSNTGMDSVHLEFFANANLNGNLINLNLSDNQFQDEGFESLIKISEKLPLLKRLNISNNNLTSQVFERSQRMQLNNLEILDVSDNRFDNDGLVKLINCLNSINLKNLNLSRNRLITVGLIRRLMIHLMDNPTSNLNLEILKLSRCHLDDSELFSVLMCSDHLKEIDLSYNQNLTGISLKRLLERRIPLIDVHGCDDILKNFNYNFEKIQKEISLKITINPQYDLNAFKNIFDNDSIIFQQLENLLLIKPH